MGVVGEGSPMMGVRKAASELVDVDAVAEAFAALMFLRLEAGDCGPILRETRLYGEPRPPRPPRSPPPPLVDMAISG